MPKPRRQILKHTDSSKETKSYNLEALVRRLSTRKMGIGFRVDKSTKLEVGKFTSKGESLKHGKYGQKDKPKSLGARIKVRF